MRKKRTCIVTGGGNGIGRVVVKELAKNGDRVYVVEFKEELAKAVCADVKSGGGEAIPLIIDVTKYDKVQEAFEEIGIAEGGIDVLVNCVGGSQAESIMEVTEEIFDQQILFNLKSCFNCCKAVVRAMTKLDSGRIINISSVAGLKGGLRGKSAYMASKAGVIGLTKGLARELAPYNIMVNAVAPSMTASERMSRLMEKEDLTPLLKTIPLNRAAQPEEVAAAIVFLASEQASYITGIVLCVDGGYTMY